VTLKEVISRLRDLAELFETTFEQRAHAVRAFVFFPPLVPPLMSEDGRSLKGVMIDVLETKFALASPDDLITTLGLKHLTDHHVMDSHNFLGPMRHCRFLLDPTELFPIDDLPTVRNDTCGETYIVTPVQGQLAPSTMSLLLQVAYFEGMLADTSRPSGSQF
jgi:hypothetical protein